MKTIAIIHSPFKEKFSIPRQPGLTSIESQIQLVSPFNRQEALVGLEAFSHIWVLFCFHQNPMTDEHSLMVRPPRLGGNQKQGVFATRSPFRPNNIGLSLVELKKIDFENATLTIIGGDFLDQTPVVDIKPYIKERECLNNAQSSWTDSIIDSKLKVKFDCDLPNEFSKKIQDDIIEILSLDPRPRFHEDGKKSYGSKLFDFDIHWKVEQDTVIVFKINNLLI